MGRDFIYLASASPRRGELLRQIGVEFVVREARISEQRQPGEQPVAYVERLARDKAARVWQRIAAGADPRPVLAADTTVVLDGEMFGKPRDRAEALQMLERLSGQHHEVLTAVAVQFEAVVASLVNSSKVRFRATTPAEREAYCETREPFDKAGGYGIQGLGAVFVEQLTGSYSSVMGLPLFETAALLRRYRVPCWLHRQGLRS